eukprot:5573333-Amphidinium_carterae.1
MGQSQRSSATLNVCRPFKSMRQLTRRGWQFTNNVLFNMDDTTSLMHGVRVKEDPVALVFSLSDARV